MALIIILCLITLAMHGFAIDHAQFATSDLPWSKLGLGVVVAIFSLVGFECATAFGDEARDPLKTIPRAVWMSLVISGAFFVFVTYTMVQAVRGYQTPLDQIDAPLNVMAVLAHVPALQAPISAGAMFSFFALCLSCINAGGRVIYAMGRHGLLHGSTANAHATNETPHIAVTVMGVIAFLVPTTLVLMKVAPLDVFNYVGTLAAFGFLVPYFLITLAAPTYLRRLQQLRPQDIAICAASLLLLIIPAVGSVYPVPDAPICYFPYLYLVYLGAGVAWIVAFHRSKPAAQEQIRQDLDLAHAERQTA
jgi:amino acid transporter